MSTILYLSMYMHYRVANLLINQLHYLLICCVVYCSIPVKGVLYRYK